MSIEQQIRALQEALGEMERSLRTNTRTRAVAVKSKNLMPGDEVEWPYGFGRQEITGMSIWPDRVCVASRTGFIASFPSEERVRVYRG